MGEYDYEPRETWDIKCLKCGKPDKMPFKPRNKRVWCRECVKTFKATPCAKCGLPSNIAFEPDGKRKVYCRDCLRQNRLDKDQTNILNTYNIAY